jgi:hypothetical protein
MEGTDAPIYTEAEWQVCVADSPLGQLRTERVGLLHRHWMWTNISKGWFTELIGTDQAPRADDLAGRGVFTMYLWYAMLWSVIEALTADQVRFAGRLRDDLRKIRVPLENSRNAVFHIGDGYHDRRLFQIMEDPDSVGRILRVHSGLGRMLLEELRRRTDAGGPASS